MFVLILSCARDGGHALDAATDSPGDSPGSDTQPDSEREPCALVPEPERSLPILDACTSAPPVPSWSLHTRWERTDLGASWGAAVVAVVTGGGVVIVGTRDGALLALSGADGATLWQVSSAVAGWTTPAVGDIDGDGRPEIFIQGESSAELRSGADGTLVWSIQGAGADSVTGGAVGMADFEGDGDPEVFFGRRILDAVTGARICDGSDGAPGLSNGPISVAADLDGDGDQELVAGNTAYDASCEVVWSAAVADGFPAVADFDGDDRGEVVVVGAEATSLLDEDGDLVWQVPVGGGPPAIADVDGDGAPEVIVPTRAGVTVLADGAPRWSWVHPDGDEFDGVSAYDLDGNGAFEVLLNTPEGLVILDGTTGALRASSPGTGLETRGQEPVVADLDGDREAEVVYLDGEGVRVVVDEEGFAGADAVWNQHAYAITNVEGTGGVPAHPAPNWPTYNSFRAGAPIADQLSDSHLTGEIQDVCESGCPGLQVAWAIGNDGAATVGGPVIVQLWGATDAGDILLAEEQVEGPILPGVMLAGLVTALSEVPTPLLGLFLGFDAAGGGECAVEDDIPRWDAVVCP